MTSTTQTSWAFLPTTAPFVSPWYETVSNADSRPLPQVAGVCAVDDLNQPQPFLTSTCIEVELPGGGVIPLGFAGILSVQLIAFPARWRIAKPPTVDPVGFVLFGYGTTPSQTE